MKARKAKAARQQAVWRNAVRQEKSRRGDECPRPRARDVHYDAKKRKRMLAEVRSTARYDKEFRRTQLTARRLHQHCCFRDSGVCDVDTYQAMRMDKADPATRQSVIFKWLRFEQRYKLNGQWHAPLPGASRTDGLFGHFDAVHSAHSLHRTLIARCREEVWGESSRHHAICVRPYDICQRCGSEMKSARFFMLCTSCGNTNARIKRKDMNFKELECVQDTSPSYKRDNHLHEWITRVQALERKVVPVEVKKEVLAAFDKWGFDRKKPTKVLVRKFLRDAGYQRYFEHVPQIMQWLSGSPQIHFTDDTVQKIKRVFREIQAPFERHKPKDRKNFLSYSYVLYKVCELLELDHMLHAFSLLKSRQNLMKADKVWKGICADCGYQYIPTV